MIYSPYTKRLQCLTIYRMMLLQRQHILHSYFKTLSVGLVWDSNPLPPTQQTGALPSELTTWWLARDRAKFWVQSNRTMSLLFLLTAAFLEI